MSAGKLLRKIIPVATALALLAAMAWVFTYWRLDRPSSAEGRLARAVAERKPVPPADNVFAYLWAFDAAADVDPAKAGATRLEWVREFNLGDESKEDPHEPIADFKLSYAPEIAPVVAACTTNQPLDCLREFDAFPANATWSATDSLLLSRYEGMLRYRAYQATVGQELKTPLPPWSAVLAAQRLYFLRMLATARAGDVDTIRTQLTADLTFWRMTQESADILIPKMIAIAAVRQHFFCANLVLRHLPPARVRETLPESWKQPASRHELSMWLAFAGEVEFARSLLRGDQRVFDESFDDEDASFGERTLERIGRGIFPPRMMVRRVAAAYAEAAEAFEVPLERYLEAQESFRKETRIIDPSSYCVRAAALEVWRRAALLAAELHADAVPATRVPERVASSALRDPLTGKPFVWKDAEHAIVVFMSEHGSNNREVMFFH